ncbi:DNA translocase FtsK [Streptomyces sp. NPDC006641]|uniref:DNA translocase FtsK n=1 Tax=unclassified Streptomyces TaxID=2593676 RepID=UPI0036B650F7
MFDRPRNHEPIPWRHGTITTPLYTAATVYAGGLAMDLATDGTGLPIALMGLGSITGIVTAAASRWFRTRHQTGPARTFHTAFTATWTAATYAWLTWASHDSPWTMASAATVAIATAALTPAYAVDRYLRHDMIAAQWAEEAKQNQVVDGNEWERLFEQAGARGVKVQPDSFTTRGGYALPLKLTGTPYAQILPMLPMIETKKGDLRTGALDLRPGDSGLASDAVLYVSTRDVLSESIDLPDDTHPLTITEPLTLGALESGEPFEIKFRQNSVFIAGKKGSGKSVLLHCIISVITRCTDAVIWMIDMAEGNTAKRWLRPWVEQWKDQHDRLIDRPILDWVATSVEEAVRLLRASVAVADGRARRMPGGKIRPTATTPALIVITDENPELMSRVPEAIQEKIRGIKKGRKAAVDYIDAAQRGTGPNTGGGEVMSQYDTVIGGRFPKKGEGQFVFPDYFQRVDLSKLPGDGSFYVLDEKRSKTGMGPEKFKGYFIYDDDEHPDGTEARVIEEKAVERWDIRPDLDKQSQADADPYGYSTRWAADRINWLLDAIGRPTPASTTEPATPAPAPQGPARPARPSAAAATGTIAPLPSIDSYIERAKQYEQAQAPAAAEAEPALDPAAVERLLSEAENLTKQAAVDLIKPTKNNRRHPRRDEVTNWVRDAGKDGITVADVRARLEALYPGETPPSDTAVQNWFTAHPNIQKPGRGVYVWTTDEKGNTGDQPGTNNSLTSQVIAVMGDAVELVVAKQHASAAFLQRNLRIGWEVANTVIADLAADGVISATPDEHGNHPVLRKPQN